ncbi:MAG: hypothetical protein HY033_01915 [Ignavibacteriae bacterium]|nr:hypothetical protein [Ignavibacteria bacterium]MBI3363643.1 hypothetical protein [Ignavibacteriota bacterium]
MKFYENGQPTHTGADAALFPDSPTRTKLDLAGTWRYTMNGKEWNTVTVPSSYDFKGKVTFMRSFEIKSEMLDKYVFSLVVFGINYQSEIAINGNFVSRHMGGYTSFIVPIPSNTLQVGSENSIKVAVDNELTPKTTLPPRQPVGGWKSYGGIFRDIYILATPKLYIENVDVTYDVLREKKNLRASVRGEIMDRGTDIKTGQGEFLGFQVEAYNKLTGDLAGKSGVAPFPRQSNKSVIVSTELIVASPKLWSPDTADLYTFKCQIVHSVNKELSVIDEHAVDIGFRDFQWNNGQLLVNGSRVPLKGILWHEDHALFGSALTYEAMEKDIALIKTLGANLIRFPYPPHPYLLNLCDRYGILVMEEIPLTSIPDEILAIDYYQDLANTYIREMVSRDKQHSSVLTWGIGGGIEAQSNATCEYVTDMRNVAKALDRRPVYFASYSPSNPCFEYVDLVAINYAEGDAKDFRESLKHWKAQFQEKPIIVARYGKEVEPGNHSGYSDPLSMESQARTVMTLYDAIKDARIAGGVFWSFNDWRTDRPALTTHSHDPYLQAMGLVTTDREKRVAFDVVRSLYNGEKVQALPVGNYSSNAPMVYVLAGITALISFFFMYNGNRRFRDCANRSLFRTYNFFADVRDQRILTYAHSLFVALVVSVTWAILLSSILSHYRNNLVLDNLLSQIFTDNMKESLVRLIWNPVEFILVVSGIIFLKLIVLSIIVRLCSMMVRTHVYFYHAFSITMWSMLPYILLIPVSMILYRLSMETEFYMVPMAVFVGLISVWVLIRLLKGISIIYDVFPLKVYVVSFVIIIVATAVLYSYLDYTQSTSVYVKYILESMRHPS